MLHTMRSLLLIVATINLATITVDAAGAAYTLMGTGPCRGNGGALDKVNSRMLENVADEAACEAYCDAVPADGSDGICAGFAYESSGDKECILYGPGMAGSCASPNQAKTSPTTCTAVGTCSDPTTAASEKECGTCSLAEAVTSESCATVAGTWTGATWTTTGVWEDSPVDGAAWVAEFQHTDHVHSFVDNVNYVCYDKDVTDHIGKCSNSADSPGGTDCAAIFSAAGTYEADSCPSGDTDTEKCVWTAAPASPTEKPPHPVVPSIAGYTFKSGACRATSATNAADPANLPQNNDRPNYMYKKNADFPTFPANTAPADLAAYCDTLPNCLGFHSGPWMSLFGTGLDAVGEWQDGLGGGWAGDPGQGPPDGDTTTLTATKPNHQYVCFYKSADSDDDEPCFPSAAMVTKSDGTHSRVDALVPGDKIIAATSDGTLTTDTVSLLSIAKHEALANMVNLTTAAGKHLILTSGHHLPVGKECCTTLKKVAELAIGETVHMIVEGKAVQTTVVKKTALVGQHGHHGLHSPVLTNGAFPVVDNVVTSFDSMGKVTLAKYGLAYLEAACKATGTCDRLRRMISPAE
jgi:hypothetical protein